MQRSKIEIYLHIVWATNHRTPWLTPEIERAVYRCISDEITRCKCEVLALNGMPDHVHLVVKIHSTTSVSALVKAAKGTSSIFARDNFEAQTNGWQDNYAAFSVSRSHLPRVIRYVQNQKQHHAENNLWPEWEETSENE